MEKSNHARLAMFAAALVGAGAVDLAYQFSHAAAAQPHGDVFTTGVGISAVLLGSAVSAKCVAPQDVRKKQVTRLDL